MTDDIEERY